MQPLQLEKQLPAIQKVRIPGQVGKWRQKIKNVDNIRPYDNITALTPTPTRTLSAP